ncbi:MAG: hypothetical protein ACI9SP_003821 [Arenicella sp.]|jgi:hypothetical protein
MNDLVFLIVNASIVCFIASFVLLKVLRSKVLILCLVFSPFVLIPFFDGAMQELIFGYVFVLQYGGLGIVLAVLLFELDKITRARRLRYLTSSIAKMTITVSSFYVFVFIAKNMVGQNETVNTSLNYASAFGILEQKDLATVEYLGSFFHVTGVVICVLIILSSLGLIVFNKYRAFREVQRV